MNIPSLHHTTETNTVPSESKTTPELKNLVSEAPSNIEEENKIGINDCIIKAESILQTISITQGDKTLLPEDIKEITQRTAENTLKAFDKIGTDKTTTAEEHTPNQTLERIGELIPIQYQSQFSEAIKILQGEEPLNHTHEQLLSLIQTLKEAYNSLSVAPSYLEADRVYLEVVTQKKSSQEFELAEKALLRTPAGYIANTIAFLEDLDGYREGNPIFTLPSENETRIAEKVYTEDRVSLLLESLQNISEFSSDFSEEEKETMLSYLGQNIRYMIESKVPEIRLWGYRYLRLIGNTTRSDYNPIPDSVDNDTESESGRESNSEQIPHNILSNRIRLSFSKQGGLSTEVIEDDGFLGKIYIGELLETPLMDSIRLAHELRHVTDISMILATRESSQNSNSPNEDKERLLKLINRNLSLEKAAIYQDLCLLEALSSEINHAIIPPRHTSSLDMLRLLEYAKIKGIKEPKTFLSIILGHSHALSRLTGKSLAIQLLEAYSLINMISPAKNQSV